MKKDLSLEQTADGSPTLYAPQFKAHYHSTHGALQESLHVFIQEGLQHFIGKHDLCQISILEYGMGTGLNAFLTHDASKSLHHTIHYHGIEGYPVPRNLYEQLDFTRDERRTDFLKIHESPWNEWFDLSDGFSMIKEELMFEDFIPANQYHIIYFDAFGPRAQPHLWEESILRQAYEALHPGGIIVTFCAQGQFKRSLKSLGFEVERVPGPPGKREMTRGTKI